MVNSLLELEDVKNCDTCLHEDASSWAEPCHSCGVGYTKWEPKTITPAQDKALERAVADDLGVDLAEEEDAGWQWVGFVALLIILTVAGGLGFLLGAAWRGAQMMGGFHG